MEKTREITLEEANRLLKMIIDESNIDSEGEYVIISLTVPEWQEIRDFVTQEEGESCQ